ncbi:histone-lysine N-trimethyltransferase SMYD5 [Anthonomus grandis grandis]|uniref:histone-lysine N-trimethyltransferase SMYD5 n=1 Tax=Anthonomus grandis grandis TaxID=2921223 RepID=UPI002165BD53|nr:histone-lysine N-trimethyltransferase SMYD5 [Anthonomus grandis grandis]
MSVEVRRDTPKGKSLHATRHIPKDTVIFEEDPLICCQLAWNAACKYRACDHCLRPLETAEENSQRLTGKPAYSLPYPEFCQTKKEDITSCPDCGVEYCSEICKTIANEQYHRVLCLQSHERNMTHPLEQLEEAWKHSHYPPETSSIFLLVRLLARIVQSPNKDEAIRTTLDFCHRSVNEDAELAHKFLGAKFAHNLDLFRELIGKALPNEGIEQFLTPEGFRSLVALIGTNGQGVGSSPFSVWTSNIEKANLDHEEKEKINSFIDKTYEQMFDHTGDFLNSEGVGLYLQQSCANHSCEPNAEIKFLHNNFRLSLFAIRDIEPNEEVLISYLDECSLNRSRHSRQKALMENYLFTCDCLKCLREIDDPDMTSEEEMSDEDCDD